MSGGRLLELFVLQLLLGIETPSNRMVSFVFLLASLPSPITNFKH